jgi:hypothetical protein
VVLPEVQQLPMGEELRWCHDFRSDLSRYARVLGVDAPDDGFREESCDGHPEAP